MNDFHSRLEALRERIRVIEARSADFVPMDQPLPGSEVQTPHGHHLEISTTTERHGGFHFSRLEELPETALAAISGGEFPNIPSGRIAFLDTETTGAVGGAGTVAFLVGIGRMTDRGFGIRQYFMRDLGEEVSVLHAVAEELREVDLLVTYNGKAYDEPLLTSRYALRRMPAPFTRLQHLDLLHSARRLWKLRFDSCRLVELESQILGYTREGDVAGGAIPFVYLDYLRTRRAGGINTVLQHNALDILSLAALTAILPARFENTQSAVHAAEIVGLGRWLISRGDRSEAIPLFERAITRIEFDRLPVAMRRDVFVELAKHYERKKRDFVRALEMALEAALIEDAERHHRRIARLQRRLAR